MTDSQATNNRQDDGSAPQDNDLPKCNFSDLVGQSVDDPAFDVVIASQRKIDWTKW